MSLVSEPSFNVQVAAEFTSFAGIRNLKGPGPSAPGAAPARAPSHCGSGPGPSGPGPVTVLGAKTPDH